MAPKRSSTRAAAAAAGVQGARVSKTRSSKRMAATRGTTEQARRLLLEEQIQQKKKEVRVCRGSITKMKKALAAEEAKLAKNLSALEELEKDLVKPAKPAAGRVTRRRAPIPQTSEKTGCEVARDAAAQAPVPPPRASKREKRKLPQDDAEEGVAAKRRKVAEAESEKEQEAPPAPPSRPEEAGSSAKAGSPSPPAEGADAKDNETRPEAAWSTREEEGENNSVFEPVGLPNPGNACFANSVMQLLATALGKEAIDGLAVEEGSATWSGASPEDCIQLSRSRTGGRGMLGRKLAELRQHITESGRDREIPISGLLGRALKEMLSGEEDGSAAATFMLRQVFAYSGREELRNFNGDSQQDAGEYLIHLFDALVSESPAAGGPFAHQMQETIACECGGVASVNLTPAATSLPVTIPPLAADQTSWEVEELLEHEMAREELDGYVCPTCQLVGLSSRTKEMVAYPERLLVTMNRADWVTGRKIATPVALPTGDVRLGTESYRMTAMVQHRGPSMHRGHYVAFRKQQEAWVELDDDMVKQEDVAISMQDTAQRSSVVFLLEKS